jgi:hypothetical protein
MDYRRENIASRPRVGGTGLVLSRASTADNHYFGSAASASSGTAAERHRAKKRTYAVRPTGVLWLAFASIIMAANIFSLPAQSLNITSPSATQTISGTSFVFTASISNLPSIHSVEYAVDVPGETVCISATPPFSCVWNTFNSYNSTYHTLIATARDALNATIAVSQPVPFTIDNWLPEHVAALTLNVTPSQSVDSPISGNLSLTKASTGTNSGTSVVSYYIRIDGLFANDTNSGGAFGSNTPDTRLYENGTHTLTVIGLDSVNAIEQPPYNGNFQQYSQYEKIITTANANSPMEIRTNAWEMFLCPGAATLCPATFSLTAKIYNTDGSTSPCTSPAFTSANPAVATVGASSGLVTAVAQGSTTIITTCSGFPRNRSSWVFVNNQNIYPNFGMDSSGNAHIYTAYDPTSVYVASSFQSCAGASVTAGFYDSNYPPGTSFGADYTNSGWNTCEPAIGASPSGSTTQAAFTATQNAFVAGILNQVSPFNIMMLPIGDSITRGDPAMELTMRGVGSTYSPPAPQIMAQSWVGKKAVASSGGDEIQSTFGDLSGGSGVIGTAAFTGPITCTSGATCVVTGMNFSTVTAADRIIITGSGDSNLDYNFSSGNAAAYLVTCVNPGCGSGISTSFSFPTPAGVGTHTYTSLNNSGLTIHYLLGGTWDASNVACPPEGASSGPCPNYVHNDDFATLSGWLQAPTSHFPVGWSNSAATSLLSQKNWAAIGNFSTIYYADGQPQWLAQLRATNDLQTAKGQQMRTWYSSLNPAAPVLLQVGGTNTTYNLDGYTPSTIGGCTISTIVDNLVTCSGPHGLANILDNNTRVTISGASLSTDNSQFFINTAPTATTFTIYYREGQFVETDSPHNTNGVAHFSNGTSVNVFSITSNTGDPAQGVSLTINSDTGCAITPRTPGMYVTFTGSAMGSFVGPTFYVPYTTFTNSGSACSGGSATMTLFQIPAGSSTGGTANIQPSNDYVRGINIPILGSEIGPRHIFADSMYNVLLRASGARLYVLSENWNGNGSQQKAYNTTFTSKNIATGIQSGASPRWDSGGAVMAWHSVSLPVKFIQRFKPYIYQPNLVSPDYGPKLECAARRGPSGNLLMCQSFSDGSVARTIDLTPYLVTGQTILRYYMTWQGLTITRITANTASDTITLEPAGFVAYLFSNNAGAEYNPPVFSARLADVTNATKIVVQYSYLPFPFTNPNLQSMTLPLTVDCGTGTCVLPVDRQIGTVFYRILYLNSAGTVLATSDIQQL